jgi:hypothetical protein
MDKSFQVRELELALDNINLSLSYFDPKDLDRQDEDEYWGLQRRKEKLEKQLFGIMPRPATVMQQQPRQQQPRQQQPRQRQETDYPTFGLWIVRTDEWKNIKWFITGATAVGVDKSRVAEAVLKHFENFLKDAPYEDNHREFFTLYAKLKAEKLRDPTEFNWETGERSLKRARAEAALIEHKGNVQLAAVALDRGLF